MEFLEGVAVRRRQTSLTGKGIGHLGDIEVTA